VKARRHADLVALDGAVIPRSSQRHFVANLVVRRGRAWQVVAAECSLQHDWQTCAAKKYREIREETDMSVARQHHRSQCEHGQTFKLVSFVVA
jgi:hypothetical protein